MQTLVTERLSLRKFTLADSTFIMELVNTQGFLQYIGDKNVKSLQDAEVYLKNGPLASYQQHGYGLLAVELLSSGELVGSCGLLKRDSLDDPDIGFAFLPQHYSKGYATEAGRAVLEFGLQHLQLTKVIGLTDLNNYASMQVLQKIGLQFDSIIHLAELGDEESRLYVFDTKAPSNT